MWGTIQRSPKDLGLPDKTAILSFDDGPVPAGQTATLVDLLNSAGLTAAFCLVGRRIPGNESLLRTIAAGGHLIVNHGHAHRVPDQLSDREFQADLDAFDNAAREALGLEQWSSSYFRPPGGRWNRRIERLLRDSGRDLMPLTFFAWDIFPFPFRKQLILAALLSSLRRNRGGLFLLHEAVVPLNGEKDPAPARNGRGWLIEMVGEFVELARADGFTFIDPRWIGPGRSG